MSRRVRMKFRGMNNLVDPVELGRIRDYRAPLITEHVLIQNFLCTDQLGVMVRPGQTSVYAGAASAIWSTPDEDRAFIVHSGVLRELYPDDSTVALKAVGTKYAAFEEVNGIILFSDGETIWVIDGGTVSAAQTPTKAFKAKLPAGHILCRHNSRILVATEEGIEFSDSYHATRKDTRLCRIPFPGKVLAMTSVDDGVWASTINGTFYLKGKEPEEFTFVRKHAAPAMTSIRVDGKALKMKEVVGPACIWVSDAGVFIGTSTGEVISLSEADIALKPSASAACGVLDFEGGTYIIAALKDPLSDQNVFTRTAPATDDVVV